MAPRSGTTMRRIVASALTSISCLLAGDLGAGRALDAQTIASSQEDRRLPQVEVRAPGVFDGRVSPIHEHLAQYRINATVLFPLFSIPIAHRDDVGFALTSIREFPDLETGSVRTHELFAASFPNRARGLNRMGFIREAVGLGRDGARWTAHFGALSSNPETSRQQVELDADETTQSYTVMDGFTDKRWSWNRDARLQLEGAWSSPLVFYATLIPVWRTTELDPLVMTRLQAELGYPEPLGFLGIVSRSLRIASMNVHQREAIRKIQFSFTHKGELMYLSLRGHRVDRRRQQAYVADGLIERDAVLHQLHYRVLDADGREVRAFTVWTELPAGQDEQQSPPIIPVAFEFKAKSFLELEAVRVSESNTYR